MIFAFCCDFQTSACNDCMLVGEQHQGHSAQRIAVVAQKKRDEVELQHHELMHSGAEEAEAAIQFQAKCEFCLIMSALQS
jgi:hypothetical protein